jgi:hypothetical protein
MREHLLWHLLGDPSMEIRSATPSSFDTTKFVTKFEPRRDAFPIGDPPFRVRVTTTQAGTDGTTATLLHAGQVVGRAPVSGGVALITPTIRTDSASLTVALERDGFIPNTLPVSAPVPTVTIACPTEFQAAGHDNVQVSGKVTPLVSGATVGFRVTHPNGTVTTHSTTTGSSSTYLTKIPISTADRGSLRIQALFDGALKYGANQADCTVSVF